VAGRVQLSVGVGQRGGGWEGGMSELYEPASEFLKAIVAEEIPLSGSPFADENLRQLVEMTRDSDVSNRDWATMLLATTNADTPAIRAALLQAAQDENEFVRGEAMVGIAKRDRTLALPLVRDALRSESVPMQVFEAAALIADPALVDDLRALTEPSEDEWLDRIALDALEACETRTPPAWCSWQLETDEDARRGEAAS
jgi:HEAT repeat protein